MLPKELRYLERFKLAVDAGFAGIEMQTVSDAKEAEEIREAAAKSGLRIHSVMNSDHWRFPISSADPEVVSKSVAGMETSLRNAKLWGAEAVLLVPAVVDASTSYQDAWTRSQKVIRERLLPLAGELKVVVAVEEVWNRFLLSPLEFARYVDELASPWLKAYFDVGNVVFYGYPQDWIRTLGKRIVRVHLKDFQLDRPNGRFYLEEPGRGRRRLAGRPHGLRRDRLRRLDDDGDLRRRRRLSARRGGQVRPVPRRTEAARPGGQSLRTKLTRMITRYSVILPLSTLTFWAAIHAPLTFWRVLSARSIPLTTASSKLVAEDEMISVTLATAIVAS